MKHLMRTTDRQQLLSAARRKIGLFKPYWRLAGLRLQFRAAQLLKYWRPVR